VTIRGKVSLFFETFVGHVSFEQHSSSCYSQIW